MSLRTYRFQIFLTVLISLLMCSATAFAQDSDDDGELLDIISADTDDSQAPVRMSRQPDGKSRDCDHSPGESYDCCESDFYCSAEDRDNRGNLTLYFRLNESDLEAPFYGRYHDPFAGDSLFLGEFNYLGWDSGGGRLGFHVWHTLDTSRHFSADWLAPGDFSLWASDVNYENYNIPSTNHSSWHNFNLGFLAGASQGNTIGINYSFTESASHDPTGTLMVSDWDSNNTVLGYDFGMGSADGSIEISHGSFNDATSTRNDVEHTTGTIRIGQNFGDANYLEGNLAYNISDVPSGDDLETVRFGGYARFADTLGINGMSLSARIGWLNSSAGPSRMHPAGDEFEFDLEGRWRVAPNLWLNASWDHSEDEITHADQFTNYGYYGSPDAVQIPNGLLIQDTVSINTWNVGGRCRVSDGLDFIADLLWVNRDGLPITDLVAIGSHSLWWDSESRYTFTLRYRPDRNACNPGGDWLIKYVTLNRENGARASDYSSDRVSVNWSGMLSPAIWLYLEGGLLSSSNTITGLQNVDQEGTEIGGGWAWALGDVWSFYGDYWVYNVDGTWGYDQTSFMAGLDLDFNENWTCALEYESVEGAFDSNPGLDFDVNELLLRLTYGW